MSSPKPLLRGVFLTTLALFGVAFLAGTLQSIRRERRPPVPVLDYGGWVRRLLAEGDYARASREMEVALKLDTTLRRQDTHVALGQALARSGKLDEAIAEFRKALAADPRNAAAYAELGNAFGARGDMAAAAREYQQALEIDPAMAAEVGPKLAWARGNVLRSRGRFDEAIASYREALDARADLTDVRYDLGVTLAARGSMEDAVREFEAVVQQRPREPRFHNVLGMALLQMGRTDAALAAYKRGLEVAPNDAELRRNLSLAEAQRSRTSP